MVRFKFILDGTEINAPLNWRSLQVLATFDNSSVSANISTEEFEFVNNGALRIRNYILGGLTGATNGIFDGLPFQIFAEDESNNINVFDGYLDFSTYEEINPTTVKCGVKKSNGLNSFEDRSEANSFGYLEDQRIINNSDYVDVKYIVEKLSIESDIAIVTLALFMLTLQISKSVIDLEKSLSASATIPAPVYSTSALLLDVGYIVLLIIEFISTMDKMVKLLIPPVQTHKGIKLRRLMDIATDYLGFDAYDSPLTELDDVVYLPSKPFDDSPITKGIPNATDFGYQLSEAFALINKLTNSKIQVVGNTVVQRTQSDPFWRKTASFTMPDVLDERIKYNNADFSARTFINFATDGSDDWTVDNFQGTNYEIITTPITGAGSPSNLMKGLTDVNIPLALGTPKQELNFLEGLFKELFGIIDLTLAPVVWIINTVKKKDLPEINLSRLITDRIGVLKVSQKNHGIAKLLVLDSEGKITERKGSRELSAKALWEKYYNYNSFVSNNFGGQRRIFTEKRIPFGFNDFLACIDNSYFTLFTGEEGKVESIKWTLDGDTAEVDYWIEEVYTENLKETFIEG